MTTPEAILSTLLSRGVQLWVSGEDIRYRSPAGILTPDMLNEVRKYKSELLALLKNSSTSPAHLPVSPATLQHPSRQDAEHYALTNVTCTNEAEAGVAGIQNSPATPENTSDSPMESGSMAAARRRLEAAIDEVAAVWNGLPAPAGDRPWLDSATEERLDNAITERFRARDLPGAMAAIENWRSAWLAILPAQPSDQRRDWLAVESDVLGGEVIVFVRDDQTPVPGPHAGAVRYTVAELEPLQGLDADALRAVHAAKKALGGVVGGQDKAMSGESDARRPLARELPGLNDGEILRRLNNPKTPVREWQRCAHAAAARGLVGHPAPDHAGGFRPQPFEFCSPEKPAPGHRRWRSFQGVVVCGSCHPPAAPELVAEWLDEPKGGGPQEH